MFEKQLIKMSKKWLFENEIEFESDFTFWNSLRIVKIGKCKILSHF